MTVTDQINILNRKIKQNEAQYDLDRRAAKTSALSSNNLDKYEYLTGEDLDLKPSTVEQEKFEYSALGKIFNKGLDEEEGKKEGILKRLKNIETNQNRNNSDSDKSNPISAKSESNKKTSISDYETQTSFEYLKNNTKEFFENYPDVFDLNLKRFFNYIVSQEEKHLTTIYFQEKFYYHLEMYLIFLISMVICVIFGLMCYLCILIMISYYRK